MSDPGSAMSTAKTAANPAAAAAAKLFTELKVSAHLMTFDAGLFCIVQTPGARRPDDGTGLPGVRISLPPAPMGRPDAISFANFRGDGWLSGQTDAMLVRVSSGPAQVLVTIYQAPTGADTAPRLQVLRLSDDPGANALAANAAANPGTAANMAARAPLARAGGAVPEIVAHAQIRGDIGASFGEWIGDRGSKRWIEGFMLNPRGPIAPADIEYQAVLGRGWLSPWVEGGQLCGSRGMALPVLGLRLRLRGAAAEKFDLRYAASFVDGTEIGPVSSGQPCEADSLAPLEAFQVMLANKPASAAAEEVKPPAKPPSAAKISPRGIRSKTESKPEPARKR
jgi:hypothetical protein